MDPAQPSPDTDPRQRPAGRGGVGRGLVLALGLALVAGGAWWYWAGSGVRTAAPGAPPPPPVTVSRPLVQDVIEWKDYTGQFAAVENVEVRARVSGTLTEIHFQDGATVHKGDLLFVIDPRPFEADLALALANLERDQAQQVRAELDLKRYAALTGNDFASHQQFEQARATAAGAAATLKADQAAIEQARLNLEFTHIASPLDGRAGSHQVSVGNQVLGGANSTTTLLTTIVSLDPIDFNFDVSESDELSYKRGIATGELKSARNAVIPVQARLEDETGWPHEGHIDFVDNQINPGAGTLRLRAIFPNPDLLLTPGQFARVRVAGSGPRRAILIPDAAVVTDQARKQVMVVKPDGTIDVRVVLLGPLYHGLRIIREGLAADDSLVINGLMRVRPGARVTPQPGRIEPDVAAD